LVEPWEARRVPHPAVSVAPRPGQVPVVRLGASSASSQDIGSRDAEAYPYRGDPTDEEVRKRRAETLRMKSGRKMPAWHLSATKTRLH
jgi:alkanesulfonate monooxygenase SsuD/methylene tetrahydromethanopterin reductase-like flavin-dependent oxidoreductase (luciferase family)